MEEEVRLKWQIICNGEERQKSALQYFKPPIYSLYTLKKGKICVVINKKAHKPKKMKNKKQHIFFQ